MTTLIDKSDKGREEIATRKHQLASRLRSLLVLIDGKHPTEDLLKKVVGLGLDIQSVNELLDGGFINGIQAPAAAPATAPATPLAAESAVSMTVPGERRGTGLPAEDARVLSETNGPLRAGENTIQALHAFFNETIKSTIGLRGFTLQLKVERANTVADFRELRQPYLEAVLKAKGNDIARGLRDRLDLLLLHADAAALNKH
ncbi:hypothetical protein ACFQAT_14735 [Undibacterium arcticum]|uniref:hypothetical protein n=1 Tax=Undibacterium arcticum TaxID=1762892 RepID=UPI00360ECFC1